MTKKFKGFTLLELIIVMAIFSILMAAIAQMMKPIRRTYVESTLYETQRNTQNGITEYLGESVRYAVSLGMYEDQYSKTYKVGDTNETRMVSDVSQAARYFLNDVSGWTEAMRMPTTTTEEQAAKTSALKAANAIKTELVKRIQIITIDNKTNYKFGTKYWNGRLLRAKHAAETDVTNQWSVEKNNTYCRMALGSAFYGEHSYTISYQLLDNGIKFTASSVTDSNLMPNTAVTTEAVTTCPNLYTDGKIFYDFAYDYMKACANKTPVVDPGFTKADLDNIPSFGKPVCDMNILNLDANKKPVSNSGKTFIIFLTPGDLDVT